MSSTARIVLTSFQDGRAVLDIEYGARRARLELDQLEDRTPGNPRRSAPAKKSRT
jgi:hypothetical protein